MSRRLLPFQGWRLTLFQAVMVAVFILFSLRMYDLQIASYQTYEAAADENRLSRLPIAADRGVIFDRNGVPLARNVPAFNVTIIPALLPTDRTTTLKIFNRLSALVNVPPTADIAAASAQTTGLKIRSIEELVTIGEGIAPFREVTIAVDVDFHVALQIREERQSLPGVDVQAKPVREYPTSELTAHIVGYMAPIPPEDAEALIEQGYDPAFDRIGVDGIEYFLNNELAGKRGTELREVDVAGATIRQLEQVDPVPGQNVRLTIDVDLQKAAEDALKNEIALLNSTYKKVVSQQGVIVAMNPQNGQILAMVSYPRYDNSKFARSIDVTYYEQLANDPLKPLINNAIRSLYPPGSTWKLITASGVLQEGVISPKSVLDDPGRLIVENKYAPNDPAASQTFVCWKRDGHGLINMVGAIANSCNVYFYQVGGGNPDVPGVTLRSGGLGIEDLFRYATAFGIGSELGVELPAENRGRMPDRTWKRVVWGENWSTGDTYNAALGQGYVNVTPLQLVSMAATVANGGTLYQPTIIDSFLDPEGKVVQPFTPHVLRNVNLADVSGTLKLLLVEDMIMKGPDSLDCMCEPDSPYYNGVRCNPGAYRNTVDLSVNQDGSDVRQYEVFIPQNYAFNAQMCTDLRFNDKYRPAFVSTDNINIVREGMRGAVTVGTAMKANLPYVEVAGKTGTAQYCDNIANGLGLCKFGSWPAHAWFVAFAPYKDPEIVVAGFIYNGTEGSLWALPMVRQTLEAYYRLKNERAGIAPPPAADAIPLPATPVPTDIPTGG